MLALLPSPEAIGMVERSVYVHDGKSESARDSRVYKNAETAARWMRFVSAEASAATL